MSEQAVYVQTYVGELQTQPDRMASERAFDRLGLALRVRTLTGVLAWLEDCRAAVQPGTEAFDSAALAA